jgi:LytS/YehU family sensor histidine kinase
MDSLKAQIHPHFLFNTLNNIYSLNLDAETEKASQMISRLSSLLRYVLYKGKTEYIALMSEVEMLQDFIKLEAVRSDNLDLSLDISNHIDEQIYLPPFLLLPLVENAFKHGVNSQLNRSFIEINLSVNQEYIVLKVINSFDDDYREADTGGLGLSNLHKRLEYYYPEADALTTYEQDNRFTATLKIPLQCQKYSA